MAGESTDPLIITPDENKSNSTKMDSSSAENPRSLSNEFGSLAASHGCYNTEDSTKTYSPNEKPDRENTAKRRVPIYLRASTGSCHNICKYGRQHAFEEKSRESFRKRISKSLPNEVNSVKTKEETFEEKAMEPLRRIRTSKIPQNEMKSVKTTVSGEKNKEKAVVKHKPSADYTEKISPRTKSCSPKLLYNSPRQSALSRNKTRLPNLSPAKNSSSISELPEIIKMEILLPSEKVEVPVKEGSSNDNKMSRADKKTCDQSLKHSSKLVKVKPLIASGDSYGVFGKGRRNSDVQTGRKMTSSMMSTDKASETTPAARLSLGKTVSSKSREAGRVRSSLSLSSPLKYRNGAEKSNGEDSEKTLHVIKIETVKNELNTKARKTGRVKSSSPLNRRKGTEKSNGEDSMKTENNASPSSSSPINPSRAKSPSLSSSEEKDENEEIKSSGNEVDEIDNIRTMKESHIHSDEKIDYSNNEADELIADKIISSEIENSQPSKENHDRSPMLSSHEEDDDEEIYRSSSSESLSHAKSSSLSSQEENDEEDGFVYSDKTISMEIDKVQPPKENRKKSKSIPSDDKNRPAVKLKFRRGKIINLEPENNVPKRLRFRRARIGSNKTDDFDPDSKKSMEIGNARPVTQNKTLRKADSFISENKKSIDVKLGTPNKALLRKSRLAVSEDKYVSPVNLSRREKTVTGNNSPTRLRFTRGRAPRGEDCKSDVRKKTVKKAGGKNDQAVNGFELSSRKVILKHPEVQRKKNGQVLLNNVIEETASKLVKSRKSKVKALVGAFETVISLQETKPSSSSSHTVACS